MLAKLEAKQLTVQESYQRHTELIQNTLEATLDLADASGMVFEPDVATYYMVTVGTDFLPGSIEELAQTRSLGAAAQRMATPRARTQIASSLTAAHLRRSARSTAQLRTPLQALPR